MFKPIACGKTIPINNIHAVSVSIPTMEDVLSYEKGENKQIKNGYPRFVLHPYLKKLALFLQKKYKLDKEIVLVSSQKSANLIIKKYRLEPNRKFDEEFGIVLVEKNSDELDKVLSFIQHIGCYLLTS